LVAGQIVRKLGNLRHHEGTKAEDRGERENRHDGDRSDAGEMPRLKPPNDRSEQKLNRSASAIGTSTSRPK
jgi:hypothetical protein